MAINRVFLTGNLTRDPELRQTTGGTEVLAFGMAVNDRRKNQQTGEWEDVPNFVDVTVFGRQAEVLSRMVYKGDKVTVEGRLHYSSWEAKDGTKRSKLDVIADSVELMQRPRQAAAPAYQPAAQPAYHAQAPQQPPFGTPQVQASPVAQPSLYDSDIPF